MIKASVLLLFLLRFDPACHRCGQRKKSYNNFHYLYFAFTIWFCWMLHWILISHTSFILADVPWEWIWYRAIAIIIITKQSGYSLSAQRTYFGASATQNLLNAWSFFFFFFFFFFLAALQIWSSRARNQIWATTATHAIAAAMTDPLTHCVGLEIKPVS